MFDVDVRGTDESLQSTSYLMCACALDIIPINNSYNDSSRRRWNAQCGGLGALRRLCLRFRASCEIVDSFVASTYVTANIEIRTIGRFRLSRVKRCHGCNVKMMTVLMH